MTTMTESEINEALIYGISKRIKLREKAIRQLDKEEDKINEDRIKLYEEIKKLKDFIEERK